MKKENIFSIILIIVLFLSGCSDYQEDMQQEEIATQEKEIIVYEAMMYDNRGNNFLNFEGNSFTISPNKIKQYGWNSDGTWESYYETSSVMTIEIDGKYIQECGSTIIFKDSRLEMLDIPDKLNSSGAENKDGYEVYVDNQTIDTYFGLTNWWYDIREKGQHGEKIVLIQSQDGYNIGAFSGNEVTWEIAEDLPKTTKITVDGLPLYIHRCNFAIIDSSLLESRIK